MSRVSREAGGSPAVGSPDFAELMAAHDARLSNCVHCGFCLPACPTYTRLGDEADSPRGRLHLMRAVAEGRLEADSDAFQTHIDRCLGCRACETVCPSGVEYGFLLERARGVATGAVRAGTPTRALLAMIRSPALLALWMGAGRLLRATRLPGIVARLLPAARPLTGLRLSMGMLEASRAWRIPEVRPSTGVESGPAGPESGGAVDAGITPAGAPRPGDRVGILTGCVQAHLFARVNAATRRVLEANGFEVVDVPGQGCCGALHAHAGHLGEAREMARTNAGAFRERAVDWIAANAAGCGAAMKEYGELTRDGRAEAEGGADPDAEWFAERVRDVSELLVGDGRRPRAGAAVPLRVAYDPPCHLLHGQRVDSQPVELLRAVPGVEVVRVPNGDECCGGAGIYGITHPELGGRIGRDKVDAVLGTGAAAVATGNPGCAMQIGAGLVLAGSKVRVLHPIELLDESYRRAGFYDA